VLQRRIIRASGNSRRSRRTACTSSKGRRPAFSSEHFVRMWASRWTAPNYPPMPVPSC
jgi:hypothetical protein